MNHTTTKPRAKRYFQANNISKMESIISEIKPDEKDHKIESKVLLNKLKDVIKDAFKRGCRANEVYQSFLNNDIHLSKYAFLSFWKNNVEIKKNKTAVNKNNNEIKNKAEKKEKINLKTNKTEIKNQKLEKTLSSSFEIKQDSSDI